VLSGVSVKKVMAKLEEAVAGFHRTRLDVIKPYRHLFDPALPPSEEAEYRKVR